ncbi:MULTISPECIES: thioredoxin domain-containing protein [Sulfurospirillum]|uniref:DsbA family protein n=1 Tax=Sulfurospirillum TaxID=57665 RepID=UPI000543C769|nr:MULTISPECIES: thioredoxin domain-containing protein [Sulfurospirillum]KHG34353.1 MAG: DSBA oxidoreductase [Sulfurospirillum sp. MES]MCP3650915.1 thioredoxin domain-containing protein [Sulfurospirillum sp. DNRA8]MCR1809761.1 thioredoxin domain-containing protein [Sulfurospirillum sp. DNRA8]
MNKQLLIASSLLLFVAFYFGGSYLYQKSNVNVSSDKQSALVRPTAFVLGNPDAKTTIVEFFDPACETCKSFYPFVKNILKQHPDKLKLVLRYAPFHTDSYYVVAMIEAARLQNKYLEALEVIYKYQDKWASHTGTPNIGLIWSFLPEAGIDVEQLKNDMKKPEIDAIIKQDIADTKTLGVRATPEFFVNAKPLVKFGKIELQALIDSEL